MPSARTYHYILSLILLSVNMDLKFVLQVALSPIFERDRRRREVVIKSFPDDTTGPTVRLDVTYKNDDGTSLGPHELVGNYV